MNAFTNFLSDVNYGLTNNPANVKDYQHADRLYVRDTYARAPKVGFLYFVAFTINTNAIKDKAWAQTGKTDVGFLVKRTDLPKFNITAETLNQYNRRTVVQTKLEYARISMEFHDDNSNITNNLWKNYYQYYYADGNYGDNRKYPQERTPEFRDTKFGTTDYAYGLDNNQKEPFFTAIDIYVMHQGRFTQFTLVNPLLTEWAHDSVGQEDGTKILTNKMTIAYEAVSYKQGTIVKGSNPPQFAARYYDTTPSPLSIGGGVPQTLFGTGGIIPGAQAIFGGGGPLDRFMNTGNPMDLLGAALQTQNLIRGIGNINSTNLQAEGYSIATGVLGSIAATGNQPGGLSAAVQSGLSQNGFGILAPVGVNLFANKNSALTGIINAKPSTLTTGGK